MAEKHPEILLQDPHGTPVRVGGRRHYSPTSPVYIDHCRRIVTRLVERFAKHSSVIGWQIDNEYCGPHDQHDYTHEAFREWLKRKYGTIEALNNAWGCQFWNTFYDNWQQVMLPPGARCNMTIRITISMVPASGPGPGQVSIAPGGNN